MTRWTEAERRVLLDLFHAGASAAAIADRLGRTVGSVMGEVWEQGLRWRDRPRAPRPVPGSLADEIEAAKREAASAPLFRPGDRV